jgi:N-acetylmuramoyl-L-alanine amidase
MTRLGALVVVFGLLAVATAQPPLVVNGVNVPGATTTLVDGVTYAPAADFARAMGADVDVDLGGGRVTLTLGAAIVQLALVTEPERVEVPRPAVVRDGRARPGPAALWSGSEAFLPVKAAGEALGGRVAFLTESASVAVVLPRPGLSMRLEGFGASERLVFSLDAPGRYVTFHHPETAVLELRFERADPLVTPALEGRSFVRAAVERVRGSSEARVQLAPGVEPRVWSVPAGVGMEVVVAFSASGAAQEPVPTITRTRWVLDAGHVSIGGAGALPADVEGELTRAFVDLLAVELSRSGIDVERTRTGPAPVPLVDRTAMGVGADAMVTVHLGDLPRRQVRLYVLDDADAADTLDRAIRWNAESALDRAGTDALRRTVLLRLVTDLTVGRDWGAELTRALAANGWTVEGPVGAPLAVLAGAAGRGLFLEMSADDLRDPSAVAELARSLVSAWSALGGR